MKSQVSFKFDGEHNKGIVIGILREKLMDFRYKLETEGQNVFRIYVASSESKEKTYEVCYGIQSFVVYDQSRGCVKK